MKQQTFTKFSLLNPCPFLTINCKLTFRAAFIQSTTHGLKQISTLLFFDYPFYSDVRHNIEEKICPYLRFIKTLKCCLRSSLGFGTEQCRPTTLELVCHMAVTNIHFSVLIPVKAEANREMNRFLFLLSENN